MQKAADSRTLPTGLGFAAIVLWASTVGFGRSVTEELGTITSAFLVYFGGGVLGIAWQVTRGEFGEVFTSFDRRYLIGCGSLFVIYMISLFLAIGLAASRLQALEVGLINYLWPMLTLLFSVPILGLQAGVLLVPGAIVAFLGVVLAMTQGQPVTWATFSHNVAAHPAPYLFGLIAAVSWGLYNNLSRKWGGESGSGAVPLFLLVSGLILGGWRLGITEHSVWTARALGELAFMIVGPNLAYILWEYAMRRGDIVLVVSASYLTPLLATLIGVAYLHVTPGAKLWLGCLLIMAGAVTCKVSLHEDRNKSEPPLVSTSQRSA